jgi:hypothetical protein
MGYRRRFWSKYLPGWRVHLRLVRPGEGPKNLEGITSKTFTGIEILVNFSFNIFSSFLIF